MYVYVCVYVAMSSQILIYDGCYTEPVDKKRLPLTSFGMVDLDLALKRKIPAPTGTGNRSSVVLPVASRFTCGHSPTHHAQHCSKVQYP